MGDQWPKYYKVTDVNYHTRYIRIWSNDGDPKVPYEYDYVTPYRHELRLQVDDDMHRLRWEDSTKEEFNGIYEQYKAWVLWSLKTFEEKTHASK